MRRDPLACARAPLARSPTTIRATATPGAAGERGAPSVWWGSSTGEWTCSLEGLAFTPTLYVRDACTGRELACARGSEVRFFAEQGWVLVWVDDLPEGFVDPLPATQLESP